MQFVVLGKTEQPIFLLEKKRLKLLFVDLAELIFRTIAVGKAEIGTRHWPYN